MYLGKTNFTVDFESLGVVSGQNFNDASAEPGKYWYRIYSESDGELSRQ